MYQNQKKVDKSLVNCNLYSYGVWKKIKGQSPREQPNQTLKIEDFV